MNLKRAISAFFERPAPPSNGAAISGPEYGLDDGVNYGLPVLLPEQLEAVLKQSGQWGRFLTESAAQTFRFQFDTPQRVPDDMPFMPPTEDPLREWAWSTRRYVLENTHAAYARNPIANRACKYIAAFAVGEGFNLSTMNPAVDDWLTAFIESDDNDIRCYERQAVIDLLVDGEIMLRLYAGEGDTAGELAAVPQRPWECQWIETEPGFFRRRRAYHFQRSVSAGDAPTGMYGTQTETVDAASILHVAINRHGYELRGRPELYGVLPWLRAYKEWLENRARQNHWRTSFMWLVRVRTNAADAVAAVASRWRRPPTPGSIAVENEAVSVEPLANPVGANDASEDGRQIKLMNAVGFGLPEYMLSDGSNANLASSTSQTLPALMTFADIQRTLVEELWTPLFRRVLQDAVDAGRLPDMVEQTDADGDPVTDDAGAPVMVRTVDAFSVSYAPLNNANVQALATALEIAKRNGWIDDETAVTELGFDYSIVRKRQARDQQAQSEDMARGLAPMPPGLTPAGMPDEVSDGIPQG